VLLVSGCDGAALPPPDATDSAADASASAATATTEPPSSPSPFDPATFPQAVDCPLQTTLSDRWALLLDAYQRHDARAIAALSVGPESPELEVGLAHFRTRKFVCLKTPVGVSADGKSNLFPTDEDAKEVHCILGMVNPSVWSATFVKKRGVWFFSSFGGGA
jgi:hypothetical protein